MSKVFFSFCPACRVKLTPLFSMGEVRGKAPQARQTSTQTGDVGGECLLYKRSKGHPILGRKNRTHPPNLPHQEAHPGAALDPPLQPEGDPAPFQPPVGSRSSWSCAPRKRRQSRQDSIAPALSPGVVASSPCFFPLPTHTTPPQQTQGHHISTRQQTRAGGAASLEPGSRRPCTSSPAFSPGVGRAQPGWPRQTRSSGPAE